MPLELMKSPLKVCKIVGENVFSTVVEEDINVPDANPDLYKILAPSAVVVIKDCEVMTDKVMVNGQVLMNILYAADLEGKPMYSMDVSANFSQGIEIPGAKTKMRESVNAVVQLVDCRMLNSRKLNIRIIMDLNCRVEEISELELATDIRGLPDMQLLREPCKVKQIVGHNKDEYELSQELALPGDKPTIDKVLKADYKVVVKDEKLMDGKIEVSGVVGVSILYRALDELQSLDISEFEVPFTQYIEIPAAERDMECMTDSSLKECYLELGEDANGDKRVLNLFVVLKMNAKVYKDTEQDMIVDAYSPTNVVEIGKDMYKMHECVGKNRSNAVVKETLGIRHGDPEIEKVCCVNVLPVVNDVKLMDDRVAVEGMMECTAVYQSSYSAEPMYSITEQIPFRHYADIPGTKLGMHHGVKCSADHVMFSQINSEVMELRVVLSISVEIMKQTEKKLVNRLEEKDGVTVDYNKLPAVTVYMLQKGDTLWSIAKRYNTTVDALARLNNIENPSKVSPGMHVMVLKNIRMNQSAAQK